MVKVINTHQDATSTSALMNSAAKDDVISFGQTGLISDLLANDPGSAKFVGIDNPGFTVDQTNGTWAYTGSADITGFDYTIRLANGTYSHAHVDFTPHLGSELVQNFSFENDSNLPEPLSGGWVAKVPDSWTSTGATPEIVAAGYAGTTFSKTDPTASDGHWVDSQGSPGGIDLSQTVDVQIGVHAQLSVRVAWEVISGYNPDDKLEVSFGGNVVGTITAADLTHDGAFQSFNYDVVAVAASETIEIKAVGSASNVGFAIDSVSLKEWVA